MKPIPLQGPPKTAAGNVSKVCHELCVLCTDPLKMCAKPGPHMVHKCQLHCPPTLLAVMRSLHERANP